MFRDMITSTMTQSILSGIVLLQMALAYGLPCEGRNEINA